QLYVYSIHSTSFSEEYYNHIVTLNMMRKIFIDQLVCRLAVRICKQSSSASVGKTLYVFVGLNDLSVRVGEVIDALERALPLVALRDGIQSRMRMVPAVIPDFQDAGLRCFRPPDVTPLIQADNASLVEHRARFRRSDNERRTFRLRPVPPVARATLLEDRIEALDVAEIRMSFDVEIVE